MKVSKPSRSAGIIAAHRAIESSKNPEETYKIKVSEEDTPGFMNTKLEAGDNITIEEVDISGTKKLVVNATGGGEGSIVNDLDFNIASRELTLKQTSGGDQVCVIPDSGEIATGGYFWNFCWNVLNTKSIELNKVQ